MGFVKIWRVFLRTRQLCCVLFNCLVAMPYQETSRHPLWLCLIRHRMGCHDAAFNAWFTAILGKGIFRTAFTQTDGFFVFCFFSRLFSLSSFVIFCLP